MSHKHTNEPRHHHAAATSAAIAEKPPVQTETTMEPAADEVRRRAYFSYLNEGARPGHDVQHWLDAEAKMLAERKLTRTHGYHNPT